MTTTCMDLVKGFYNLDGDALGERKKNLYKLLNETAAAPDLNNLDDVLQELTPTTYLETLFKVEVLIFFRRTSELLDVLKSGNEILISKVIKQRWFFKEAFGSIDSEVLVNEYFPCMSFAVRMKVLKKLSQTLTEPQMDDVFDSVLKRYGLFTAKIVLSGCSSNKIETVLNNEFVNLRPAQLIIIYNKNPTLIDNYLDEYRTNKSYYISEYKLLKYIAMKDPRHYYSLQKKYDISLKLGRNTSKKIIDCMKDDIINDPDNYILMLRLDTLTRKLKRDFKKVFFKLFPNSFGFEAETISYLKYFPPKHQYSLFINTFNKVFKSTIWKHPNWHKHLFPYFSNSDREKWAERKYNESHDLKYVKYFPVDKSIPLLKEKINLSGNISERCKLLKSLIESCVEQKDMDLFEDVLKYFCTKHRNETGKVRFELLALMEDNVDLALLNDLHWKYIDELITLNRFKNYCRDHVKLRTAYIEFLWKNEKPIKKVLLVFFQDLQTSNPDTFTTNLTVTEPKLQRDILLHTIDLIPEIKNNVIENKEFIVERDSNLLNDIADFNKMNPDMMIYAFDRPRIMESIKIVVTENRYCTCGLHKIALQLLFKEDKTEAENTILEVIREYFKKSSKDVYFKKAILKLFYKSNRSDIENQILKHLWEGFITGSNNVHAWLLKYAPAVIMEHFDDFTKLLPYLKIWQCHLIKMYSHINLDVKTIEYCQNKMLDPEFNKKQAITKTLALVMPPEDYARIIEDFVPMLGKVDFEHDKLLFNLQCAIAKSLKYAPSPSYIPILFKLFAGDLYTRNTMPALYSTFYRLPENTISKHFSCLTNKLGSIREHALILGCVVSEKQTVLDMLKSSGIVETNICAQKQLFSATLRCFLKNPSYDLCGLLNDYMKFLDKFDTEAMESLSDITIVPKKYRGVYFQGVIDFYGLQKDGKTLQEYKNCIILEIDRDIMINLPIDFCQKFIEKCFLQTDHTSLEDAVNKFVLTFLYCHDNQKENFNFIFNIVNNRWLSNSKVLKNMVYKFFNDFFQSADDENDKLKSTYFSLFNDHLNTLLNPINSYPEYIYLKLLNIKQKTDEPFVENFAPKVVLYQEELTATYGPYFGLERYAHIVDEIVNKHKYQGLNFACNLLKFRISTATCIMALKIITYFSFFSSSDDEQQELYANIVETLKNVNDPGFIEKFNRFDRYHYK